jgi:hypothetical protein
VRRVGPAAGLVATVASLALPATSGADHSTVHVTVPPEVAKVICDAVQSNTRLNATLVAAQVRVCTTDPKP